VPDIRPTEKPNTGYPAGFSTQHSNFKYLVKLEINKSIRGIEGFIFPYLKHSILYNKAVKVLRRHFGRFYELIWLSLQFGRISIYFPNPVSGQKSGNSNPVSRRIPDVKKGWIIRCIPTECTYIMAVIRYRYLHNAPSQNYKQLLAIM
jgi:hypothetical protein